MTRELHCMWSRKWHELGRTGAGDGWHRALHPGLAPETRRRGCSGRVGRGQDSFLEKAVRLGSYNSDRPMHYGPQICLQPRSLSSSVYCTPVANVPQAPLIHNLPKLHIFLCSLLQFCPLPKPEAWIPPTPSMSIGPHPAVASPPHSHSRGATSLPVQAPHLTSITAVVSRPVAPP